MFISLYTHILVIEVKGSVTNEETSDPTSLKFQIIIEPSNNALSSLKV